MLAYIKCLILNFFDNSIKLQNPIRLLLTYASGFFREYLTPAWAARLITLENIFLLKIFLSSNLFDKSTLKKKNSHIFFLKD